MPLRMRVFGGGGGHGEITSYSRLQLSNIFIMESENLPMSVLLTTCGGLNLRLCKIRKYDGNFDVTNQGWVFNQLK